MKKYVLGFVTLVGMALISLGAFAGDEHNNMS